MGELITSSILCTPREPSSIGTSVRVWKKVSSPRLVRISLPSRRITRKSVSRPPKVRVRKKAWSDPNALSETRPSTLQNFTVKFQLTYHKKKKKKKKSTRVDTTA